MSIWAPLSAAPLTSPWPGRGSSGWEGDWNSPGGAGMECFLPGSGTGDRRFGVRAAVAGIAELLRGELPREDQKTVEEQGPAAAGYGEATAMLGMLVAEGAGSTEGSLSLLPLSATVLMPKLPGATRPEKGGTGGTGSPFRSCPRDPHNTHLLAWMGESQGPSCLASPDTPVFLIPLLGEEEP